MIAVMSGRQFHGVRSRAAAAYHELLVHRPDVWRLQLPVALGVAACGWLICLSIGTLAPTRPETLWTQRQIESLEMAIAILLGMGACFWGRLQLRYLQPERTRKTQLRQAVVNFIILLLIVSAVHGSSSIIARHVSQAMPWNEVRSMYSFHEAHQFWNCPENDTPKPIDQLLARIRIDASRLGLDARPNPNFDASCRRALTGTLLQFVDRSGVVVNDVFVGRLKALRHQHDIMRRGMFGLRPGEVVASMTMALVGALALWILAMPRAQAARWGRSRVLRHRRPWRRPGAWTRFQHRLLLNRPEAWVVGSHVFALRLIAWIACTELGLSLFARMVEGASWNAGRALSLGFAFGLMATLACESVRFVVRFGRFPLRLDSWRQRARLNRSVLIFASPMLGLAWLFGKNGDPSAEDVIVCAVVVLWMGTAGISIAVLANTFKPLITVLCALFGLVLFVLILNFDALMPWVLGLWGLCMLGSWLAARQSAHTHSAWATLVASTTLLALPAACMAMSGQSTSSVVNGILLIGATLVSAFVLIEGACQVLIRGRYLPHRR